MYLKKTLQSKRAEAYIGTGVKIIIAVVLGGLLLGGLFLLFTANSGIFPNLNRKIQAMMNVEKEPTQFSYDIGSESLSSLQYTYDGNTWIPSSVPTYSENAIIVKYYSNLETSAPASIIAVEDNSYIYLLASTDRGATWKEVSSNWKVNHEEKIVTFTLTYSEKSGYYFLVQQMNRYESGGYGSEYGSTDGFRWVPLSLGRVYF